MSFASYNFFSDVNIDKFRQYFFINPHFFFLLELLVKWPPLGHVEESQSTQLEKKALYRNSGFRIDTIQSSGPKFWLYYHFTSTFFIRESKHKKEKFQRYTYCKILRKCLLFCYDVTDLRHQRVSSSHGLHAPSRKNT